MREIYSGATSVLVWLGDDRPDIDALLGRISQTADIILLGNLLIAARLDAIQTPEAELEELQRVRIPESAPILDHLVFQAMRLKDSDEDPKQVIMTLSDRFAELFRNAWFSRVWTLQEAVFAKHLVLLSGWSRATLEEFQSAFFNFHMSFESDASSLEIGQFEFISIMNLRSWHKRFRDTSRLETSTDEKSGASRTSVRPPFDREASNPRDYVYGQLGLFNPMVMDRLKPDYSLRIEEVFIAGTVALLESDKDLDALGPCCALRKDGNYSLPSWCRDWSDRHIHCGIGHVNIKDGVFTAAAEYRCQIKYQSFGSPMFIRGLVIDEIHKSIVGFQIRERLAPQRLNFSNIWQSILIAFSSPNAPSSYESPAQVLCRTLLHDIVGFQRLDEANISEALAYLQESDFGLNEHGIIDHVHETFGTYQSMRNTLRRNVWHFLKDRCIFETKEHRFGQSCHHVRPGDKICLLYGGRLPFILRKASMTDIVNENGETVQKQSYQMIGGECYVHGLVDGEGLEIARRKDLPVEDFCLI